MTDIEKLDEQIKELQKKKRKLAKAERERKEKEKAAFEAKLHRIVYEAMRVYFHEMLKLSDNDIVSMGADELRIKIFPPKEKQS